MKTRLIVIFSILIGLSFTSCNEETVDLGNWVKKNQFDGTKRSEGVYFSINDYGYWGMGYNATVGKYFTDMYRYNPTSNAWSKLNDFPGTARAYAVCTNNDTKGYVGLGYDGDNFLNDFWEYDAANDSWTQIADFPGGARIDAVAFTLDDYLFVGMGMDDDDLTYKDLYCYHGGAWDTIAITGFPEKIYKGQAITKDGAAYVLGGSGNGPFEGFVKFDIDVYKSMVEERKTDSLYTANPWVEQTDLNYTDDDTQSAEKATIPRYNGVAFVAGDYVYLSLGVNNSGVTQTTFEYDEVTDVWTKKSNFEAYGRQGSGVFVLNGAGYVVGGNNGSTYYDDLWMFEPFKELNTDDN